MIEGMNAAEIAEYFAVVDELEPDVELPGELVADATYEWTSAQIAGFKAVFDSLTIHEVPADINDLCDQLPKVPTLDEQCARHRLEFQDEIRGLRSAGIATILCGLVLFALVIYWRTR